MEEVPEGEVAVGCRRAGGLHEAHRRFRQGVFFSSRRRYTIWNCDWSSDVCSSDLAQHAGLKFFNVYGPNEYHKGGQRSVAHQLYPRAVAGEKARLFKSHNPAYPDGGQKRDFVWVGDRKIVV